MRMATVFSMIRAIVNELLYSILKIVYVYKIYEVSISYTAVKANRGVMNMTLILLFIGIYICPLFYV